MICDVCGKTKATVHLTEIVNDQVTKLNLCEACAKKKGSDMEQHFGIADLLQGLAEFGHSPLEVSPEKVKCSNCGMTYEDFKKIGRLGCGECYGAFRENLSPLLKRIHGATRHVGHSPPAARTKKVSAKEAAEVKEEQKPKAAPRRDELEALRLELRRAIDAEQYEKAAAIRDQIKALETPKKKE